MTFLVAKIAIDASMRAAQQRRQEEDLADQPYFSDGASVDPSNEHVRDDMDDRWEPMPQTNDVTGEGQEIEESESRNGQVQDEMDDQWDPLLQTNDESREDEEPRLMDEQSR